MAKLSKEKYLILIVEDSENCRLIRIAMSDAGRVQFIGCVSDEKELVACLQGRGKFADQVRLPIFDLLSLELLAPRSTGFEVLDWLQTQPFDDLIVVVLSGARPVQGVPPPATGVGANCLHLEPGHSRRDAELVEFLER